MAGPNSTVSRRQRQNTDQASPQARTHITRTRRSSFRRQHQQHRHQLPEEDRFVELRRSARIARLHQEQHRELHLQQHQPASTMAEVARRTYARNDHGPRSVESRRSTTRPESSQHRHSTTNSSSPYTLTLTTSPPSTLSPSTPFPTRLLITTARPSSRSSPSLLAVISLCTPSGIPLPAGSLLSSTQKLMDSVSEPTRADLALLSRADRANVVGTVGFEGLVVREAGEYRVRVTLARMEGEGWEAVAEVDSGVFRVQGRGGVDGVKR